MSVSKLLCIVATVLFAVAFVVFAFVSGGDKKIVLDCVYLGLACFAAAHAV